MESRCSRNLQIGKNFILHKFLLFLYPPCYLTLTMVYCNSNLSFEKKLMQFMSEQDPMLSMLKWLCEELMEAEVASKVNAGKSERTSERSGYSERKRSEAALMNVIQEAYVNGVSTRKIEKLAKSLGIDSISRSPPVS